MKYYLQSKEFRSCDQVCGSHGLLCTAKDHGFKDENILNIFQQLLGRKCKTGFNDTDGWNEVGPSYADYSQGHEQRGRCLGWKNIPKQINCEAKPHNAHVHRLCPCINGMKCLEMINFIFKCSDIWKRGSHWQTFNLKSFNAPHQFNLEIILNLITTNQGSQAYIQKTNIYLKGL